MLHACLAFNAFLVSAYHMQLFQVFVPNALHGSRHTLLRHSPILGAPCTLSIAAYTCSMLHYPFASMCLVVILLDNLLTIFGTQHMPSVF
jgi:hypothetical protein